MIILPRTYATVPFFFHKDAPMDPDVSAGTGNGIQGVDMFALPTSRSFGLNLKLNF